jgi:hypothetical protein
LRGEVFYNSITNLVSTFVGEGYAAEVVVTGKGSPHQEPYARGTGYWHTYNYQHPEYQYFTHDLFKNIAIDSIQEDTYYRFRGQLKEANKEAEE